MTVASQPLNCTVTKIFWALNVSRKRERITIIMLTTKEVAMQAIRQYTTVGDQVYVNNIRMGNTKALMFIIFGKEI